MSASEYYIGVDVGTGSARACVIDATGEIKGLAAEDIRMWKTPPSGDDDDDGGDEDGSNETHYEQSTADIWRHICSAVRTAVQQAGGAAVAAGVRGIGFDATCSLAVLAHDTDEPVDVAANHGHRRRRRRASGDDADDPHADADTPNVILWLDHRALRETDAINATGHGLLRYVGGTMNVEMEIPKVLWLKNHLPPAVFARCKFYDLADALTHLATGAETRSFCSTVCKQGYVPVGVDGSVKGWQPDFYAAIGLGELADDNFLRVGGVNGVNGQFLSAGERVGPLSAKAAAEMGLPEGVAVGSGVIDAYAGWIGTVGAPVHLVDDPARAADAPAPPVAATVADTAADVSLAFTRLAAVAGTSTCHLAMSRDAVFVDGVWGPYRDIVLPGFWMAEGGQSATGELIRHVVENHVAYPAVRAAAAAAPGAPSVFAYLNARLRALAAAAHAPAVGYLARHLFFYGDLWGNRSPLADPHMRGAYAGLRSTDSETADGLALLYYAALEFIALQTRHIVDTMNHAGHGLRSLFMSGSQCQNDLLVGLIAAACNLPVVLPRYANAAVVHGAAMLGAKAATGTPPATAAAAAATTTATTAPPATEPLWSIMTRMTRPGRVVYPAGNAGETRLLQAKFNVFLEMLQAQRKYRRMVDVAVEGWKTEKKEEK